MTFTGTPTTTTSSLNSTIQPTSFVPTSHPMEASDSTANPSSPSSQVKDLKDIKSSSITNGASNHKSSEQSTASQKQLDFMVLSRERLQELVAEIDPDEQLDEEVEDHLLQLADDFIENVVTTSCLFAKHRDSRSLEVKDVQIALEKNWGITVPGFSSSDEIKHCPKYAVTEAHKQRLQLIKKNMKKF